MERKWEANQVVMVAITCSKSCKFNQDGKVTPKRRKSIVGIDFLIKIFATTSIKTNLVISTRRYFKIPKLQSIITHDT